MSVVTAYTEADAERLALAIAAEFALACRDADPAPHLIAALTALLHAADVVLSCLPVGVAGDVLTADIVLAAPTFAKVHPQGESAARGFIDCAGPLASVVFSQTPTAVAEHQRTGTLDTLLDLVGLCRASLQVAYLQRRIDHRESVAEVALGVTRH